MNTLFIIKSLFSSGGVKQLVRKDDTKVGQASRLPGERASASIGKGHSGAGFAAAGRRDACPTLHRSAKIRHRRPSRRSDARVATFFDVEFL